MHTQASQDLLQQAKHPDTIAIETLQASLPKLSEKDREFARSLLDQSARRGLSEKQMYWVRKLITQVTAPAPVKASIGDMTGIKTLIAKAAQHLKFPAIVLGWMDDKGQLQEIRINVAGERAKVPGSINVKDYNDREIWYGRILANGDFEPNRKGNGVPGQILQLLEAFALDPAKVASAHGMLTGRCAFCNSGLKDAKSTSVGYGPVCAKNYSLPWGKK